jgi:hypothetical protein
MHGAPQVITRRVMSDPMVPHEFPEVEVLVDGDVPDAVSLGGSMAEASAGGPGEEPLVGRLEDLENGSAVGWTD